MEIFCLALFVYECCCRFWLSISWLREPLSAALFHSWNNKWNEIDFSNRFFTGCCLLAYFGMCVCCYWSSGQINRLFVRSFDWICSINCTYVTDRIEWHITNGYTLALAHPFHFVRLALNRQNRSAHHLCSESRSQSDFVSFHFIERIESAWNNNNGDDDEIVMRAQPHQQITSCHSTWSSSSSSRKHI